LDTERVLVLDAMLLLHQATTLYEAMQMEMADREALQSAQKKRSVYLDDHPDHHVRARWYVPSQADLRKMATRALRLYFHREEKMSLYRSDRERERGENAKMAEEEADQRCKELLWKLDERDRENRENENMYWAECDQREMLHSIEIRHLWEEKQRLLQMERAKILQRQREAMECEGMRQEEHYQLRLADQVSELERLAKLNMTEVRKVGEYRKMKRKQEDREEQLRRQRKATEMINRKDRRDKRRQMNERIALEDERRDKAGRDRRKQAKDDKIAMDCARANYAQRMLNDKREKRRADRQAAHLRKKKEEADELSRQIRAKAELKRQQIVAEKETIRAEKHARMAIEEEKRRVEWKRMEQELAAMAREEKLMVDYNERVSYLQREALRRNRLDIVTEEKAQRDMEKKIIDWERMQAKKNQISWEKEANTQMAAAEKEQRDVAKEIKRLERARETMESKMCFRVEKVTFAELPILKYDVYVCKK
jgi:hypothetical protein